ncbi:unnamed protein product [Rhizoctonia solani]|uniref:Peptidase C14 caspase domain-containing protein n=1 Tax=Rhizoctonia solani TaxID=456999 RepID=A0A8H3HKR0_9AGAM|nr:unnamed protein product [Rhizoctonia solani]
MDPQSTSFRSSGQRRSFIIPYGGFLRKLVPRATRRSLGAIDPITPRPRPASTHSLSALAAATLLGLAQAQRMPVLSDAVDSSLSSLLAVGTRGPPVLEPLFSQPRAPVEQSGLLSSPLDGAIERSMSHHDSSDLSPTMSALMLPPALFGVEEQRHGTSRASHYPEAVPDFDAGSLAQDLDRAIPLLLRMESNTPSLSSNETNSNTHPMPIPQHMRTFMRPSAQAGVISSPFAHNNRRFLGGSSNRSSSSVLTATTYVTAPTGTSPPPSIRSMLRCESPGPLPSTHRRVRVQSIQSSSLRQSVVPDDFDHEPPWPFDRLLDFDQPNIMPEQPRPSAYSSSAGSSSRKILIIGSSYKGRGEVKKMFSIESLDGVFEDRDQLTTLFKERGYSVQTLIEEGFNKERALARVREFLRDAASGDVRAIVFTGHGHTHDDGTVWLVPPECPSTSEAISRAEWDKNIQTNANPGVVVFSIMAHCHSGDVMKQDFDFRALEPPAQVDKIARDKPIYLTFAASDTAAFESWVTRPHLPVRSSDHFIHALVGAIRSIDVGTGTWGEFFEEFDRQFHRARSCASWQDRQGQTTITNWRLNNHQSPRFSASGFVRLSVVF